MSMPAVQGPYTRPGGFGYVYFVAAVYAFAGVRSQVVYLIQTFLFALSVLGFVHAFRRRLTPFYLLFYGLLVIVFAYLDHFRFYTFRLLSENLLIFLLAPLFITFERLLSSGSRPPRQDSLPAHASLCVRTRCSSRRHGRCCSSTGRGTGARSSTARS